MPTFHMMLLKRDSSDLREVLKEADLTYYPLKSDIGFSGEVYVRDPQYNEPDWRKFLQSGVAGELPEIVSRSNAAVLSVRTEAGTMVFTFGYGRTMVDHGHIVPNFGLKVALNTVDPEKLRSVDVKTLEELSLLTRRQSSQLASLGVFNLDTGRDLLRGVTGKPQDPKFASSVSGADGLALTTDAEFAELGNLCKRVIAAYRSTAYKQQFGWIDQLQAVRDAGLLEKLDGALLARLRARDVGSMHMAPPELMDWEDHEGFGYSTERQRKSKVRHLDLSIGAYLDTLGDISELTIDKLRSHRIIQHTSKASLPIPRWSIYDAIVFETETRGRLCVLSEGLWYEVDRSLNSSVNDYVSAIAQPQINLPPAHPGEKEEDYNRRAAEADSDMALLDQVRATCEGAKTPIEPCDILTKRCQFVHVKRRTRSSSLSHLFAQGTVSAEAFKHDRCFRSDTRNALASTNRSMVHLIPLADPDVRKYQVIYAVITDRADGWPVCMPFFSKLHLRQAARRLQDTGYKVGLLRIHEGLLT